MARRGKVPGARPAPTASGKKGRSVAPSAGRAQPSRRILPNCPGPCSFPLPEDVRRRLIEKVLQPHLEQSARQHDLDSEGTAARFIQLCEDAAGRVQRMREVGLDELRMTVSSRRGHAVIAAERAVKRWTNAVQKLAKVSADEAECFVGEIEALQRNARKADSLVRRLRSRMPSGGQAPELINEELTESCKAILATFGIHARPGSIDASLRGSSPLFHVRSLIWEALPGTVDVPDQRAYAGTSVEAERRADGRDPPREYLHSSPQRAVPD